MLHVSFSPEWTSWWKPTGHRNTEVNWNSGKWRKINPAVHFQMISGEPQLSSLTVCYTPGLLDFIFFYSHAHSAEVRLLCVCVCVCVAVVRSSKARQISTFFFFFSLSSFKVHKLNFSPTWAAGSAQTLGRGSMEEEQGTLTHLLTQKHRKRLTGNWFKALLSHSGAEFQCCIFFFFFFSPQRQWFSLSALQSSGCSLMN